MKIVFITTGLGTGGAEVMLLKLLKQLRALTIQLHVVSLGGKGDLGHLFSQAGIPLQAFQMRPGVAFFKEFIKLVGFLKQLEPDVVQCWMYHADLIGGIAARCAGVPRVAWGIRNSNLDPIKTKWPTRMVAKCCALLSNYIPTKIVSCSHRARDYHIALGYVASKFVHISNGFELDVYKPNSIFHAEVRSELLVPAGFYVVGLVGRYDPQKNHLGFLEAAAEIKKHMPEVIFVLVGANVDQNNSELVEKIKKLGLRENTRLLGKRTDIPRIMGALDVLASSSYGEAFPNVLGEAMACGVPCVVTDVGDSATIVGETGKVVAVDDMAGLAVGILELIRMPAAQKIELGQRARQRVLEYFDIVQIARQYATCYRTLSDRR
jgi:glycosyltransferase involved in cell wall biosynthesis